MELHSKNGPKVASYYNNWKISWSIESLATVKLQVRHTCLHWHLRVKWFCKKILSEKPPCNKDRSKYCATCNRWFLSKKCFKNHFTHKVKGKLVCQWRQSCLNCSFTITGDSKHECFHRFWNYWNKKQLSGHFCCVNPFKHSKLTTRFMYVIFDSECTQDFEIMIGPLNIFRTSYVLSRCVQNVNRWVTWVLIVNSVVTVPTRYGRNNS